MVSWAMALTRASAVKLQTRPAAQVLLHVYDRYLEGLSALQ
jgi:hypothetical protein